MQNDEPHERYGPCDGFGPGGECSECARTRFSDERAYVEWLRGGDEAGKLTRLVRAALAEPRQFRQCCFYDSQLDETTVLVRDCSCFREAENQHGVVVLRDNHDGGHVVGIVVRGRLDFYA